MSLIAFPSMPLIKRNWQDDYANPYIMEQLSYDYDNELQIAEHNISMLNDDQWHTFNKIFTSTCAQNGQVFFLHGPGGTGKTFLYNTVCH